MIPKVFCRTCDREIAVGDRFCSACGSSVEWPGSTPALSSPSEKTPAAAPSGGQEICPLCGHRNSSGSAFCESCGGKLKQPSGAPASTGSKRRQASAGVARKSPLKSLQSWKFTAGLAVVLIGTIVILRIGRNDSPSPPSPQAADAIKEIEALQKQVDANPKDERATLRLANLLHDVKFLPRAIVLYEKYLEMSPSDADARVDLGVTYFELSVSDSANRDEYLDDAKQEMEKALTYAPKHQLAHFNLGIVCLHSGDIAGSNEWLKKCVQIDPNSETGRKAQQLINQHTFNNPS